jgi:hypothetical protein
MTSWLGTGVTVKSRGSGLGVEETAWLPGKATVTALIVRIRRTMLKTAREYLDLIKERLCNSPRMGIADIRQVGGRPNMA